MRDDGRKVASSRQRPPAFVGRTAELAALAAALSAPPAVVCVEGEPGVGKSRLVRQVLRQLDEQQRTVLTGRCQLLHTPLPYGPVIEAVRPLAARTGALSGSLDPVTGALRAVLPEFAPHLPPAPPPGDAATQRQRVFSAFRRLLAAFGPVVLVLEDVHRIDPETLDLLRFLVCPPTSELTAVLVYRREDQLDDIGVPRDCEPDIGHVHIVLHPLCPGSVRELAASLLGLPDLPDAFTAELHRRTAGVARAVEEMVLAVREHLAGQPRLPTPEDLDAVGVPAPLRNAMAERIAPLGPTVAALARAVAVLDVPVTEADLAAVCNLPPRRVTAGLVRALRAGVLHDLGGGRYGFRHPLARDAMHMSLPGPQRRLLHARAAAALLQLRTPPRVRLARHHREAGDLDGWVRQTLAAVTEVVAAGDTAAATGLLGDVLADPALPAEARDVVAVRLSRVAQLGVARTRTLEQLRAVLRDEPLGRNARGEVRMNLGMLLLNQAGQPEAGAAEIELAVPDLQQRPTLAARGMAALAMPTFGPHPVQLHRRWLEQAERISRSSKDTALIAAVQANRVSALMQTGDPRVWAEVATLPGAGASSKVDRQLARTFANLADGACWIGHFDLTRTYLERAAQAFPGGDEPFLRLLLAGTRLRLDAATGRWDDLAQDAARLIGDAGDMQCLAAEASLSLACLALGRGERTVAAQRLDEAVARAQGNNPLLSAACAGRATLALTAGEVAVANVEAERGIARIRRKDNWVWAAELAPVATHALVRARRLDEAVDLVAEYAAGVAGRDAPFAAAAEEMCRALVAGAQDRPEEAAAHSIEAAARYGALPHRVASARASEWVARYAGEFGDQRLAVEHLTAAIATYTELGAEREAARCRRALGRHGSGETRRGRKGYGSALSPREQEVARLAGEGMTNRQIAEALFLSPRTVEQHVAKAMRKQNVQSRAELEAT